MKPSLPSKAPSRRRQRTKQPLPAAKAPTLLAVLAHFVRLARNALGNQDLELADLLPRTVGATDTLPELRKKYRAAHRAFLASGGRGVEAADEVDRLAVLIALRKTEAKFL